MLTHNSSQSRLTTSKDSKGSERNFLLHTMGLSNLNNNNNNNINNNNNNNINSNNIRRSFGSLKSSLIIVDGNNSILVDNINNNNNINTNNNDKT
jgi:hypothetical protein